MRFGQTDFTWAEFYWGQCHTQLFMLKGSYFHFIHSSFVIRPSLPVPPHFFSTFLPFSLFFFLFCPFLPNCFKSSQRLGKRCKLPSWSGMHSQAEVFLALGIKPMCLATTNTTLWLLFITSHQNCRVDMYVIFYISLSEHFKIFTNS